jgi:hypothetical protein
MWIFCTGFCFYTLFFLYSKAHEKRPWPFLSPKKTICTETMFSAALPGPLNFSKSYFAILHRHFLAVPANIAIGAHMAVVLLSVPADARTEA